MIEVTCDFCGIGPREGFNKKFIISRNDDRTCICSCCLIGLRTFDMHELEEITFLSKIYQKEINS